MELFKPHGPLSPGYPRGYNAERRNYEWLWAMERKEKEKLDKKSKRASTGGKKATTRKIHNTSKVDNSKKIQELSDMQRQDLETYCLTLEKENQKLRDGIKKELPRIKKEPWATITGIALRLQRLLSPTSS